MSDNFCATKHFHLKISTQINYRKKKINVWIFFCYSTEFAEKKQKNNNNQRFRNFIIAFNVWGSSNIKDYDIKNINNFCFFFYELTFN